MIFCYWKPWITTSNRVNIISKSARRQVCGKWDVREASSCEHWALGGMPEVTGGLQNRQWQGERHAGQKRVGTSWATEACLHFLSSHWTVMTDLNRTQHNGPWISKSDLCQPVCSGSLTARREWTESRKRNITDKKDNHRLEPDSNRRTYTSLKVGRSHCILSTWMGD